MGFAFSASISLVANWHIKHPISPCRRWECGTCGGSAMNLFHDQWRQKLGLGLDQHVYWGGSKYLHSTAQKMHHSASLCRMGWDLKNHSYWNPPRKYIRGRTLIPTGKRKRPSPMVVLIPTGWKESRNCASRIKSLSRYPYNMINVFQNCGIDLRSVFSPPVSSCSTVQAFEDVLEGDDTKAPIAKVSLKAEVCSQKKRHVGHPKFLQVQLGNVAVALCFLPQAGQDPQLSDPDSQLWSFHCHPVSQHCYMETPRP